MINIIELYKFNNKNFDKAGDIVLQPSKCILTMELETGLNEIELIHQLDKEGRWKYIHKDDVISIPTPYLKLPQQLYRIYDREKNMSSLVIKARHIFYDLIDTVLIDVRPTDLTGEEALNYILKGTGYIGYSNIEKESTAYYIRKNIVEAIGGDKENSFLSRWGGELFVDNFKVYINEKVGMDNGVRISYGKNLTSIEETLNLESVITRAIPVGYDGIMLEGDEPWVDSPLINNYANIKMKVVNYDDIKVKESSDDEGFETIEEARQELKRRVIADFEKRMDKPLVNYSVQFLDLSKVEAYKEYRVLEEVLLGDTVHINHKRLGIDLEARVIKIEYNCLTNKMENIELGNYIDSYAKEMADNSITIDNINNSFDNDGNLKGANINGAINAIKSPLLAQKDSAIKTDIVSWKTEVTDPNDPNFGCMTNGSKGILISNKRTPDGRDWDFRTAISADGIVADWLIGKLKTVLIENMDGSFSIDLNKPGGAKFFNRKKLAMEMKNNALNFYNFAKEGDYIGQLGSFVTETNKSAEIGLVHDFDSDIVIIYPDEESSTGFSPYLRFDKYNTTNMPQVAPIKIYENIEMNNNNLYNPILKNDKSMPIYVDGVEVATFGKEGLWLNVPIYNKDGNLAFDPMAPQGETVDGSDELRNKVVNSARKLIGKWYVYGGNYPPLGGDSGTDCSGLMQWAYNDNGIKISRTTYTQIREGTEVTEGDLKPGDLVFPSTEHVFMYSGEKDGKHMCVEAAHTGTQIRERAFTWGSNYRARRIIKESSSGGGSVSGSAGSRASSNIIYYVKGIEGFAPNIYSDSVGVPTLGYGMTGSELNGISTPISETSATHYLTKYFNKNYYEPVLRIIKGKGVSNAKQREIDAFSSFAYNLGVPAFSESTLLKKYTSGERGESIHREFKKWVHAGGEVLPGLVRRREEEWKIFSGTADVAGYNGRPYIDIIGGSGSVTANGGYGASPY